MKKLQKNSLKLRKDVLVFYDISLKITAHKNRVIAN